MATPQENLQAFYYLIQSFTSLRPGPSFLLVLQRAGIKQIEPPTQKQIDALVSELFKKESTNAKKFPIALSPMVSAPAAGGGILNDALGWLGNVGQSVRNKIAGIIQDFREGNPASVVFVSSLLLVFLMNSVSANDEQSASFFQNFMQRFLVRNLSQRIAITLFAATGYHLLDQQVGPGPEDIEHFLEELGDGDVEHFLEEVQDRAIQQTTMINLKAIPSSGKLTVKKSELGTDPITFDDFKKGNKVVVINDNKAGLMKINSLQSWIARMFRDGREPTNPLTNQVFTVNDIKIYTLDIDQSGGKRKRTLRKKHRKTSRKHRSH